MSECPHGDDPSLCPPCVSPPRPKRHRVRQVGPVWAAMFDGRCDCGDPITVGEDVRRFEGQVMHADCAERLAW